MFVSLVPLLLSRNVVVMPNWAKMEPEVEIYAERERDGESSVGRC